MSSSWELSPQLIAQIPATGLLISINILFYVFLFISYPGTLPFLVIPDQAILEWGQVNSRVYSGDFFLLFSSLFVHHNFYHLGSNLLFLSIMGFRLEELRGRKSVILVFVLSGLIGNILTLSLGSRFVSSGSSGGIFGLFGALVMILRGPGKQETRRAFFLGLLLFMITISADTNVFSHFGGLAAGMALGQFLFKKSNSIISPASIQTHRSQRR